MGWQPIETAPIDGTLVLLWARDFGHPKEHPRITMGNYGASAGTVTCNGEKNSGWVSIEGEMDGHPEEGDYMVSKEIMPTHWMPLPEPPSARLNKLHTITVTPEMIDAGLNAFYDVGAEWVTDGAYWTPQELVEKVLYAGLVKPTSNG